MNMWTIMVISYGVTVFQADTSLIPYPSREACGDAVEVVAGTMIADFPDLVVQCVETTVPSASLRPKRRPEGLGQ